jgi:hypothetical protein
MLWGVGEGDGFGAAQSFLGGRFGLLSGGEATARRGRGGRATAFIMVLTSECLFLWFHGVLVTAGGQGMNACGPVLAYMLIL